MLFIIIYIHVKGKFNMEDKYHDTERQSIILDIGNWDTGLVPSVWLLHVYS